MIHYILQTVIFQLFFLLIYDLFLKKETFFNWNRVYLLGTAALSLILPFIHIDQMQTMVSKEMVVQLPEVIIGQAQPSGLNEDMALQAGIVLEPEPAMPWWQMLMFAGMIIMATIFVVKIFRILWLKEKSPKRWSGRALIVSLLESNSAFSFFNMIFLGTKISDKEKSSILEHEMVHVRDRHSLDLMFFELLRIVFWFNPLLYLYQNRMVTLHEYIADSKAVKQQGKKDYYENLLSQVFDTNQISFVNPFFKNSLIKKRIVMLTKNKSKQLNLLKYMLLLPMVAGMLFYVSCSKQTLDSIEVVEKDLESYSYTTTVTEEAYLLNGQTEKVSDEILLKKEKFDAFLRDNKAHIVTETWNGSSITHSIRSSIEPLPEEYRLIKSGDKNSKSVDVYSNGIINLKNSNVNNDVQVLEIDNAIEVPYAVVEEVPTIEDCKNLSSNQERKVCLSDFIASHVSQNFNKNLANSLGLTGRQRINVIFKINEEGEVVSIKSRAGHEALEEEAIRVLGLLPKFEPGKQKGKTVTVPYSLPIVFEVSSNSNDRPNNSSGGISSERMKELQEQYKNEMNEVPFSVVEVPPTSDKCGNELLQNDRRSCLSNEINEFVTNNFNQSIASQNALKGRQRIMVIFKINKNGDVVDVQARAKHPSLEAEAIRVVKSLPKFVPGKHNGKEIIVSYSLPIAFSVD